MRGHEAEVFRLLGEIETLVNEAQAWPAEKIYQAESDQSGTTQISQTLSAKSSHAAISETLSRKSINLSVLAQAFTLPWSAYVRLLSVRNEHARAFYEAEALRSGWSVRQLDRQVNSQFYERAALSRNKAAMLKKGGVAESGDTITPEQAIWTLPEENPPVGLILCARRDTALAHYALDGLLNKVLAAEYQTMLPDVKLLEEELAKTRRELWKRGATRQKTERKHEGVADGCA